ncbi:MAG: DMT family transporter [Pseudomonadota bacterium]|uniref:DMT family transporter n=1 Tax=Polaromonas sp. TaxID=1869339 RepID=UPI00181A6647|nr:DMT family transporter [Polaromonas sp.]MBA3594444.1 DMT family transporter [Polaromonas sp.]MDQ3271685.1 DMT family transporter [Pseudomonadota bacterium]
MTLSASGAANRRGIVCMVGAMGCFVTNDALVKFASQSMPSAQLIFIRGLMSVLLVLAVVHALGATPRMREATRGWVAGRALVDAIATMLYLGALFHMPIGNATAINLAAPLFMTLFAALFMAERVRGARWLAVCFGFLGVLLVIQPRAEGFNAWALVCLLGTLFHAARDLMTRRIHAGIPSILITLSTAVAVTVVSGLSSLMQGWQPFGSFEFGLLALASGFLTAGYYFIISSMRHGEMTLIAPFRYTGLLFALALGYAVWGEVPNTLAWFGIALLIASGLYVLVNEKRRAPRVPASSG